MLSLTIAVQFVLSGASVQKYLREWMGLHTPVDPAAPFWVCHRSLRWSVAHNEVLSIAQQAFSGMAWLALSE
jgi:hypothetical protein